MDIAAALGLLGLGAVLDPALGETAWFRCVAGLGLLAAGSRPGPVGPRRISVLCGGLMLATGLVPLWQLAMPLALGLFVLLRGERLPGLVRGRVPLGLTLLAAAVTPGALLGWYWLTQPDLSDVLAVYVPRVPLAVLVLGALGFALVNAALEEIVWRGVLQGELEELLGPAVAVGVQALSFGVQHAHGFPRGALGVVLVATWGVLLGALRRRSGGLLAPFLAHVVADVVIAAIVLVLVRD
jgi:membrane protease YdiL (CAAX protease family)